MNEMNDFLAKFGLTTGMKIKAGPLEIETLKTLPLNWLGFSSYCATMFADFGAPDITAIAGLSRERLVGVLSLIKSEEGHDCRPVYGSTGDEKFGCLVHHLAKFGLTPNGE